MAMKKAEMEDHSEKYRSLISNAFSAEQAGLYAKALELAQASWPHIDGMIQYERKFCGKDVFRIDGIDLVLKCAPVLFDFDRLDGLAALLKSERRIAKNTSDDSAQALANARAVMRDAQRLWSNLEQNADTDVNEISRLLGGERRQWEAIVEAWLRLGAIHRLDEHRALRVSLSTQMDEKVIGKCPSCGVMAKAIKSKFLTEQNCPKCGESVFFVLLAHGSTSSN